MLTSIFTTGTNGRNILLEQGFNIRWMDFSKKERKTNVYSIREIDFVVMLSLSLQNDYGLGNQFAEVIHC